MRISAFIDISLLSYESLKKNSITSKAPKHGHQKTPALLRAPRARHCFYEVSSADIIRLCFFVDKIEKAISMNAEICGHMLESFVFFFPAALSLIGIFWVLQDGAP